MAVCALPNSVTKKVAKKQTCITITYLLYTSIELSTVLKN